MNYIENIFLCMAVPMLVATLCVQRSRRVSLIFAISGMTVCLASAYISSFLAGALGADATSASTNIAPMVEETMKLLPALFYLLVFEPSRPMAANGILMSSVGFATFENVCYLTANGASNVSYLLIRGAGTGAMHIVCGLLVSTGLLVLWDATWLKVVGTIALLGLVTAYHAIYNLLILQTGPVSILGSLLPLLTVLAAMAFGRSLLGRIYKQTE